MTGIFKLMYKITGNKQFLGSLFKFSYLNSQSISQTSFLFLDIGCGNHSASLTKKIFPNCKYYGLDLNKDYNNDENEFKLMEAFYEADLSTSDLRQIPDGMFDYINMTHVIEHIKNHEFALEKLCTKLKKDGMIFIEYPSWRSTKLPSMHKTLNFFDDQTHIYIHDNRDLANLLMKFDMQILKMGTRRNIFEILVIPKRLLISLIKRERITGSVFWSLLGFADYIIAKKK